MVTALRRRRRGPAHRRPESLGKPLADGSDFTFRPLWQLSEVEKGTLAAQLTTSITSACTSSIVGRQTALKELRQQSKLTCVWTNISDEDIAAADNDVDTGGEFGASRTGSADPSGEGQRSPARDGWREDDHPRAENGEFSEGGGGSSQQVQFSAQTHVGKSEASQTLQRQITEGVSKRFPQLAEHLRTAGYVKKVLIGEELFDGDGVNRSYKNAYAVAHPDGTIYFRSLPPPKPPDDKSRLWENWITVESQSDPQQAAVATFLHEAAHQYHFNDPDLWAKPGSGGKPGSNSELETLFQKARKHDRAITQNAARNPQEYFAESFVAALLHPVDLDKRDPEMGHFMKKWFAKQGIKP